MPSISVIMPNYNHSKYLSESLDAILNQSHKPKEVVVVDDASTDESCAVVEAYQKKHPNLLLIRMEKNSGGPTLPCFEGLKHVSGDYLALCAADDMILPGFFEEAMKIVAGRPDVAICCGNLSVFSDGVKPYRFRLQEYLRISEPKIFSPDQLAKTCYRTSFQIATQASIYRKDALIEAGFFDIELEGYSDFYLNYQIGFKYPVAYVPQPWATFRERPTSYGQNVHWKKRVHLFLKFLSKIEDEPKEVQKRWRRSGLFAHIGPMVASTLAGNPKYWHYFPFYFPKWLIKHSKGWFQSKIRKLSGKSG